MQNASGRDRNKDFYFLKANELLQCITTTIFNSRPRGGRKKSSNYSETRLKEEPSHPIFLQTIRRRIHVINHSLISLFFCKRKAAPPCLKFLPYCCADSQTLIGGNSPWYREQSKPLVKKGCHKALHDCWHVDFQTVNEFWLGDRCSCHKSINILNAISLVFVPSLWTRSLGQE